MSEGGRKTSAHVTFLDPARLDGAVGTLTAAQHGPFSLDQLRELGFTAGAVRMRVAAGRLYRIHHTVYSLVPKSLLTWQGLYMAAVLACGPGAVLSHRSAARLLELRDYGYTRIEVTIPGRSTRTHSGVAVHRSTTLTEADVTTVENIPVTTISRTLLDLADILTQRQLERAFDQAEMVEGLDLVKLQDQLARNPTRGGAKKIRRVLAEHYIGSTPTENDFEEALLALTRSLGLPDPRPQFWIDPGDGEPPIRADFAWPEQRIVVETDGRRTHGTKQAFESDRRRDQRLTAAGWRVIRITWRQLTHRPHELHPVLLKLLGRVSPNGQGSPDAAGGPAHGRPRRQLAGGSTS
jgi:hypothetical protein